MAVFVKKKPGQRAKKSSPSPLWEHRLLVTALVLSARRPFRPARFVRAGLSIINYILSIHHQSLLSCFQRGFIAPQKFQSIITEINFSILSQPVSKVLTIFVFVFFQGVGYYPP